MKHTNRKHLALAGAMAVASITALAPAFAADGIEVVAASVSSFGHGCGSPALATGNNSRPHVGNSGFALLLQGTQAGDTAGMILGASRTQWNGQSLPVDLSRIGLDGCSLYVSIDQVLLQGADAEVTAFAAPIPDSPYLMGVKVFAQGFSVSAGDEHTISVGNALQLTIGA